MQGLFRNGILSGEELFNCISRDSYYMIFVDLKAYLPGSSSRIEIKTFEDFIKSNCELVLICTDTTYIEFYCKDESVLDKVYNNCIDSHFEKIKYLSIEDVPGRNLVAW
jgi:hypothetical protein